MGLLAAPQRSLIARWKSTGQLPNYCAFGWYRGYLGDNSTPGSTLTWVHNLETHEGQPVEVIMGSMALSLGNPSALASLQACPQHVFFQVALTSGTGIANTINGNNDHLFDAIVAAFTTYGLDMSQFTIVLGWEFWYHSFDWANGVSTADYITAFQHVVTRMRAQGFTGTFMYDWTACSPSNIAAGVGYPGDAYVDLLGYHCYNAISSDLTLRTDVARWFTTDLKPYLDAVTNFARAHGKLCGASEFGQVEPPAGDTSSNTYKYHTADSALYCPALQNYFRVNSDVWAGVAWFDQDQASGSPTATTEWNQKHYFGTDPASQSSTYPHDTDRGGAIYDTIAAQSTLCSAAHVRTVFVPGSMQIPTADPTPQPGAGRRRLAVQAL